MSRKGKVALAVTVCIAALVIVLAAVGGIYAWRFVSVTGKIDVEDVDIARVPDGEYPGEFKAYHVSAEVEVTVRDGEITDVALVKGGSNKAQMEEMADRVVEEQSLEVDTVSGATVSTKAVLKAVEDALGGNP